MNETLKRHLISAGLTFVGTFVVVFCVAVSSDSYTFTKEALIATTLGAVVAAARALFKIIWEIGAYLIQEGKKYDTE